MRRVLQLVASSLLLSGCFGPSEGVEVPVDQIYFPVGLALDSENSHLFVVSSDFDLQYNAGAVQSYPLDGDEGLEAKLPVTCSSDDECAELGAGNVCDDGLCAPGAGESPCPSGDRSEADKLLFPGRCRELELTPTSSVKIGAFATDVVLRQRPEGIAGKPERLFIPVRGDSTLHWIDVEGGQMSCNQDSNGACDGNHRAGDDASQSSRGIKLGAEPFGIDVTESGRTIAVTNQTTGTASLFVNDWETDDGPRLRFALSSDRIPARPTGIVSLPLPLTLPEPTAPGTPANMQYNASDDQAAFLMTFRNSPQVRVLRFAADLRSSPPRDYLVDSAAVGIDANSVGSDSRGIAVDASARKLAVTRCGGDLTCLGQAALIPVDVYVANRAPASLLIGRTRPPQEVPYFFDSLPLTVGPSRVVVGRIKTPSGDEETRVFVVCFDSRRVFVYDPQRSRFEAEILTGRGPHALAVDTQRSRLYVGHFTDSYIGVFSLDLAHPDTYGTSLGTLGKPKTPRASK
jgi:hypothetical protein